MEGWYDSESHVVYLHLVGGKDASLIAGDVPHIDALYKDKVCDPWRIRVTYPLVHTIV